MLGVIWALLKLAFFLGLVSALAWAFTRFLARRFPGMPPGFPVRVLAQVGLGPRRQIGLLRVGRRTLVVGITDGFIGTLAELDEEEAREIERGLGRP